MRRKDHVDVGFDVLEHDLGIFQDFVIPNANELDSVLFVENRSASSICVALLRLKVLAAVELDGQRDGGAVEIQNVSGDEVLAAELEPSESSAAQRIPENGLGVGLFMTQASGMRESASRMALGRHGFLREHVKRESHKRLRSVEREKRGKVWTGLMR